MRKLYLVGRAILKEESHKNKLQGKHPEKMKSEMRLGDLPQYRYELIQVLQKRMNRHQ
jgi:hypothetical protein